MVYIFEKRIFFGLGILLWFFNIFWIRHNNFDIKLQFKKIFLTQKYKYMDGAFTLSSIYFYLKFKNSEYIICAHNRAVLR